MNAIKQLLVSGVAAASLMMAGACSDDDVAGNDNQADAAVDAETPIEDAGPDAAPDGGTDDINWLPCFLNVNEPSDSPLVECAMIDAPLRYSEPEGQQIELWVQRVPASVTPKKGQIWMLQGGPGGSGASMYWMLEAVAAEAPAWDVLTTDHRGVGNSHRLGCPAQEAVGSEQGHQITMDEWPACIQHVQDTYGADLAEFTATAAGQDMGHLVDRVREPELPVILYGVSYGTYWLIRYLHEYPNQVDGIILDSIAPPGTSFHEYDEFFNDIGEDLMGYCAQDTTCASKLGSDPWAFAAQVFDDVAQSSCPGFSALFDPGTEQYYLRWSLAKLLMVDPWRELAPAVLYRLNRCDPEDVTVMEALFYYLWYYRDRVQATDELYSAVLGQNVGQSELWSASAPDASTLAALENTLFFSVNGSANYGALHESWPVYPQDSYVGAWPTTDIPILMGNGTLDPQTPPWLAAPAQTHFAGTHQYYYELPRSPHGVIMNSPVNSGGTHCFLQMMLGFMDAPTVAPDESCLNDIKPIEFSSSNPSLWLFDTSDMWENGSPAPPPPRPTTLSAGARRAMRWLRSTVPVPKFLRDR